MRHVCPGCIDRTTRGWVYEVYRRGSSVRLRRNPDGGLPRYRICDRFDRAGRCGLRAHARGGCSRGRCDRGGSGVAGTSCARRLLPAGRCRAARAFGVPARHAALQPRMCGLLLAGRASQPPGRRASGRHEARGGGACRRRIVAADHLGRRAVLTRGSSRHRGAREARLRHRVGHRAVERHAYDRGSAGTACAERRLRVGVVRRLLGCCAGVHQGRAALRRAGRSRAHGAACGHPGAHHSHGACEERGRPGLVRAAVARFGRVAELQPAHLRA